MRIWIAIGMLLATTVGAYATAAAPVPEIDAFSGPGLQWALLVLSLRFYGDAGDANKPST